MKKNLREWLKRYLPAEILSLIATVVCAGLTMQLTGNNLKAALAGTWGGNFSYFSLIIFTDIYKTRKSLVSAGKTYRFPLFLRNLRALLVEFGLAELVDSFFIRPALMYYFPIWTGNFSAGIIMAKFAADITFYIPAIIGYELHKKHLAK